MSTTTKAKKRGVVALKSLNDGTCHYRGCQVHGFVERVAAMGIRISYCSTHLRIADQLFG